MLQTKDLLIPAAAALMLAGCGGSSAPDRMTAGPLTTVGGTVSGLNGTGLALQNNGSDTLQITGNGPFTFATALKGGAAYAVTVKTQPTPPTGSKPQTCTVKSGTGTINGTVTSVQVICTTGAARFAYVVNGGSNNISGFALDDATGALSAISGSPFAAGAAPLSLTVHASGKFAYATNGKANTISEYTIDAASGALVPMSGSPVAVTPMQSPLINGDITPVTIDPSGKLAFVGNSNAPQDPLTHTQPSNLAVYSIDATSGALAPITGSPFTTGSLFPKFIAFAPAGQFAYVLNDWWQTGADHASIAAYSVDPAMRTIAAISGSPFHQFQRATTVFAVAGSGRFAYSDAPTDTGLQLYTLDSTTGAVVAAGTPFGGEVIGATLDPTSRFLYALGAVVTSTGAIPAVVGYVIDSTLVTHTAIAGTPVQVPGSYGAYSATANPLTIDPSGKFLYVVGSTAVYAFVIDATTGALMSVAGSPFTVVSGSDTLSTNMGIDPSGRFAYITSSASSHVYGLAIDPTTGALTAVPGSPFTAGTTPGQVAFLK